MSALPGIPSHACRHGFYKRSQRHPNRVTRLPIRTRRYAVVAFAVHMWLSSREIVRGAGAPLDLSHPAGNVKLFNEHFVLKLNGLVARLLLVFRNYSVTTIVLVRGKLIHPSSGAKASLLIGLVCNGFRDPL